MCLLARQCGHANKCRHDRTIVNAQYVQTPELRASFAVAPSYMRRCTFVHLFSGCTLWYSRLWSAVVSDVVDRKYYQVVPEKSIAERLLVAARERIYSDFMRRTRAAPADRILDVGVSDVINDGANVLERKYAHQANITACGLGAGTEFQRAFPQATYVPIEPNRPLPFADNAFDIATSNAVLEHLGSFQSQQTFVRELCRVASRVFITVPNRFFPVEHHTAIPIAHYENRLFRIACWLTGKSDWSREENLILMTRKRLRRVAAPTDKSTTAVGYTGLLLGPFSSNLYLALH